MLVAIVLIYYVTGRPFDSIMPYTRSMDILGIPNNAKSVSSRRQAAPLLYHYIVNKPSNERTLGFVYLTLVKACGLGFPVYSCDCR